MATETVVITGAAFYPSVHQPNRATGVFGMDLAVNADTAEKLKTMGLKPARVSAERGGGLVTHDGMPEGSTVFRLKRKTVTAKGVPMDPPTVVDASNNPTKVLIGNGSTVNVELSVFPYEFNGKKGVSSGMNAVQIASLVPYKAQKTTSFKTVTGGFVDTGTEGSTDGII